MSQMPEIIHVSRRVVIWVSGLLAGRTVLSYKRHQ